MSPWGSSGVNFRITLGAHPPTREGVRGGSDRRSGTERGVFCESSTLPIDAVGTALMQSSIRYD